MRKININVVIYAILCSTVAISGCKTRNFNSKASSTRQKYDFNGFIGALASAVSSAEFPAKAHAVVKAIPDDELLQHLTKVLRDEGKPGSISPSDWNMIKMAVVDFSPDAVRTTALERCGK